MDHSARRQVWAVIAVLAAFLAGALFFFFSGKWHWADTRPQRDHLSSPRR